MRRQVREPGDRLFRVRRTPVGAFPSGVVVLLVALVLAACDSAVRDESGAVTGAGQADVTELRVSDCLDEPEGSGEEAESVDVAEVSLVPCSDPHDSEVYAVFDLPEGEFPGDEEVLRLAEERCVEEFADFVGLSYKESELYLYPYVPTRESWEEYDLHGVKCVIYELDTQVTGSLRDAAR